MESEISQMSLRIVINKVIIQDPSVNFKSIIVKKTVLREEREEESKIGRTFAGVFTRWFLVDW